MEEKLNESMEIDIFAEIETTIEKEEKEQITENSRFSEAIWMKQVSNYNGIVGGVGNIGSWLSLYLGRIGMRLHIYDLDVIEIQNVGGQLYSKENIGQFKVYALQKILQYLGACNNSTYNTSLITARSLLNSEYLENSTYRTILYSCFDNMTARKHMFQVFENNDNVKLLIDGRSQAEYYQILVVDKNKPESIERYKKEFLFSDEEAADAPCNFKSTTHCGSQLATMITALTTNYLGNIETGEEINIIPFFTEVNLLNMNFSMQNT